MAQMPLAGSRKWYVWSTSFQLETAELFWDGVFFIRWALSQLGSVRDSLLAGHFSPTCLQSLPPSGLGGGFG